MTDRAEGLKFPKHPRVKDSAAVALFARANPRCAVRSCRSRNRAQPHHILPRSLFGGDEESNLLNLCPTHHTGPQGPHQLGHKAWFRRFQDRLSDEDAAKVRAALRLG